MPKAKEQVLGDGWTCVLGRSQEPHLVTGLPPLAKDATADKLMADFEKKLKIWQDSSCRQQVHKMLDRECPDDGWSLDKAVCLASGSFSRDNWQNSKRSMFQFACFIDTVRHLQARSSAAMKMFAQDPKYTEVDEEFLTRLTVETLERSLSEYPHDLSLAKDHLGAQCVVFEFFMDMSPESMSDLYTPDTPLIIGSPAEPRLENLAKLERSRNERKIRDEWDVKVAPIKDMFRRSRRSVKFPRFEEDPLVFEGVMFHWKEPKDDEDADDNT